MNNFWTNSKFADIIRGVSKPQFNSTKEWQEWNREVKSQYPFRYWLSNSFLISLQSWYDFPNVIYYGITNYINNRWYIKSHQLTSSPNLIKPGEFVELGNRILPCLFNELIKHIDVTWENCTIEYTGLEYAKVKLPNNVYQDILDLYTWWKDVYLNRVNPYVASGLADFDKNHDDPLLLTDEERDIVDDIYMKLHSIKTDYENEDTMMLHRLIDVRKYLTN